MEFFNDRIHTWYSFYKRDLPWRNTQNPYFIWLSEIILQQTRIDQGTSYYFKFTSEFPNIKDLANASEDQILKLWQGLGYYSRARNLHFTARYLQDNYQGKFPEDYNSIRSLKGIGDYTAAAIASISFNLEYATVDGNVYRVLSRFFGVSEPIDTNSGKKEFAELANELIKGTNPGMHNQALMEFGALQCVPRNPDCNKCPLKERCFAYNKKSVSFFPAKRGKTVQRDRYFTYIIIRNELNTWIRRRKQNDIWRNLFEFPLFETSCKTDIGTLPLMDLFQDKLKIKQITIRKTSDWKIHILSHQRIHYRFIEIKISNDFFVSESLVRVNKEDIFNFAVPKLIEKYLDKNWMII
ncbi:MAG: A/G-specific adenine glycosylase [Prolixibacteraceae bacterium]